MPINPLNGSDEQEELENKNKVSEGESVNVTGFDQGQAVQQGGATPEAKTSSGSFVNLNQYIDANKDQGSGLGSKLASNVQQSANQGLETLGKSTQEYGQIQKEAGVNADEYTADKVRETVNKAFQNPTGLAQQDIDKFATARTKAKQFEEGKDAAPKTLNELNSFQQAKNQLQTAKDKAILTDSESGRETLLRDAFQRSDYSKGQSSLDQLFTQNVPQNRDKFESLRNNLLGQYGLGSKETQAIQEAAQKRQEVIDSTKGAASNINKALFGAPAEVSAPVDTAATNQQNALTIANYQPEAPETGALTSYEKMLLDRAKRLQEAQQANINSGKEAIKTYLKQQYGNTPWGMNLDELVNLIVAPKSTPGTATLANTVTETDLARMQALNKLAGRDANLIGETALTAVDPNRFSEGINLDYAKANEKLKQQSYVLADNTRKQAAAALNIEVPDVYGGAKKGQEGVTYSIQRVNGRMRDPAYDQRENQKMVNALTKELNAINAVRSRYGMAPISVSSDYLNQSIQQQKDYVRDTISYPFGVGAQRRQDDFNRWFWNRNDGYGQAARAAIETAGRANALYGTLMQLRDNPLMQTKSATLTSTPQIIDTSNWHTTDNGKKIPPWLVLEYLPPNSTVEGTGGNGQTPTRIFT